MIFTIIIFIFSIIGFIGACFSTRDYFRHIKNWKTLKQVNDEYLSCLIWGWGSLMGIAICGLSTLLSGGIIIWFFCNLYGG